MNTNQIVQEPPTLSFSSFLSFPPRLLCHSRPACHSVLVAFGEPRFRRDTESSGINSSGNPAGRGKLQWKSRGLKIFVLLSFLFISSCSYGSQLQQQDNRIKELEQKITSLAKEVYDLTQGLGKQQKDMESLRFEMSVLRKELMELRSPSLSPEQSQTERLTKLLQELTNPSCDTNKLAFELRKFGKRAVLALMEALKKPDPDYRARVEQTFSGLLVEDATPLLLPSLKDLSLRISAARILGHLKNYSVVDELSGYLSHDDDDFVFTVAEALVKLKDKRGVPVLIDFLKKPDPNKRAMAFNLLNKITGVTLDYKYYSAGAELLDGTKRWEEWWLKNAPTFMFPADE